MNSYILSFLSRDKWRSLATILGVAIAAFAIFILLSLSHGFLSFVESQLSIFGHDMVMFLGNKATSGFDLNLRVFFDERDIAFFKAMGAAAPLSFGKALVEYREEEATITVICTPPTLYSFWPNYYDFEAGRGHKGEGEAVLGYNVAHEVFERDVKVGKRILIEGKEFKVVGILKKLGSALSGGRNDDDVIIVSEEECHRLFPQLYEEGHYASIIVKGNPERIKEEGMTYFKKRYGKDAENIEVIDEAFIRERVGKVTTSVGALLSLFSLAALFIAALGVLNTMYTSVYEKKKEIGILKALGAKEGFILSLFAAEAFILSLVGVTVGTGAGMAVAPHIPYAAPHLWAYVGATLLPIATAVLSAVIAAHPLARKNPVELLW